LSALLWFTASDYSFGIFKHFIEIPEWAMKNGQAINTGNKIQKANKPNKNTIPKTKQLMSNKESLSVSPVFSEVRAKCIPGV
jgi:hypothetical protein